MSLENPIDENQSKPKSTLISSFLELKGLITSFGVTGILGVASWCVNHDIQQTKLELEEMQTIGQFTNYAVDEKVGKRRMFAEYFCALTDTESTIHKRWVYYKDSVVGEEILLIEARIDSLLLAYNSVNTKRQQKEIQNEIAILYDKIKGNLLSKQFVASLKPTQKTVFEELQIPALTPRKFQVSFSDSALAEMNSEPIEEGEVDAYDFSSIEQGVAFNSVKLDLILDYLSLLNDKLENQTMGTDGETISVNTEILEKELKIIQGKIDSLLRQEGRIDTITVSTNSESLLNQDDLIAMINEAWRLAGEGKINEAESILGRPSQGGVYAELRKRNSTVEKVNFHVRKKLYEAFESDLAANSSDKSEAMRQLNSEIESGNIDATPGEKLFLAYYFKYYHVCIDCVHATMTASELNALRENEQKPE